MELISKHFLTQHMKRIRRWIQSDMSKRESKFSILINSKVGIFTCINLFIFHFVSSTTESLRSNHTNDYFWTKAHLRKLGSYKGETRPDGLTVVRPTSQVSSSSGSPMVTCHHAWSEAPNRVFSWLKAPTSAFTFKTLVRHNVNEHWPHCVKLARQCKGHKWLVGWLA